MPLFLDEVKFYDCEYFIILGTWLLLLYTTTTTATTTTTTTTFIIIIVVIIVIISIILTILLPRFLLLLFVLPWQGHFLLKSHGSCGGLCLLVSLIFRLLL